MRQFAILLLASLLPVAAPAGALAEDTEDDALALSFEDVPEYVPDSRVSHWYLRGDTGFAFSTGQGGNSLTGSAGLGYQFNEWIRADALFSMQRPAAAAGFVAAEDCGGGAGTHCRIDDSGRAGIYSALLNLYVDLGTVAGFTPYLGAGAGLARVDWGNVGRDYSCASAGNACGVDHLGSASLRGEATWRSAYAVSAGLAYDLDDRLKVDFGYRFSHVGAGTMAIDAAGFRTRDDGFRQHEIHIGLRFALH